MQVPASTSVADMLAGKDTLVAQNLPMIVGALCVSSQLIPKNIELTDEQSKYIISDLNLLCSETNLRVFPRSPQACRGARPTDVPRTGNLEHEPSLGEKHNNG